MPSPYYYRPISRGGGVGAGIAEGIERGTSNYFSGRTQQRREGIEDSDRDRRIQFEDLMAEREEGRYSRELDEFFDTRGGGVGIPPDPRYRTVEGGGGYLPTRDHREEETDMRQRRASTALLGGQQVPATPEVMENMGSLMDVGMDPQDAVPWRQRPEAVAAAEGVMQGNLRRAKDRQHDVRMKIGDREQRAVEGRLDRQQRSSEAGLDREARRDELEFLYPEGTDLSGVEAFDAEEITQWREMIEKRLGSIDELQPRQLIEALANIQGLTPEEKIVLVRQLYGLNE